MTEPNQTNITPDNLFAALALLAPGPALEERWMQVSAKFNMKGGFTFLFELMLDGAAFTRACAEMGVPSGLIRARIDNDPTLTHAYEQVVKLRNSNLLEQMHDQANLMVDKAQSVEDHERVIKALAAVRALIAANSPVSQSTLETQKSLAHDIVNH